MCSVGGEEGEELGKQQQQHFYVQGLSSYIKTVLPAGSTWGLIQFENAMTMP